MLSNHDVLARLIVGNLPSGKQVLWWKDNVLNVDRKIELSPVLKRQNLLRPLAHMSVWLPIFHHACRCPIWRPTHERERVSIKSLAHWLSVNETQKSHAYSWSVRTHP